MIRPRTFVLSATLLAGCGADEDVTPAVYTAPPSLVADSAIKTPVSWGKIVGIAGVGAFFFIHDTGVLSVVGSSPYGEAGVVGGVSNPTRLSIEGVSSVSSGGQHTCVVARKMVYCFGSGIYGELGNIEHGSTHEPQYVDVGSPVATVFAGTRVSVAVTDHGEAWRWGLDNAGDWRPRRVLGVPPVDRVLLASWPLTCVVDRDELAWCWGEDPMYDPELAPGALWNGFALLQDPPRYHESQVPVRVPELDGALLVDTVSSDWFVVRSDGTLLGRGKNTGGLLGTGDMLPRETYTEVDVGEPVLAVTSGGAFACALGGSGAVYCWGYGILGHLGQGDWEDHLTPTKVPGLSGVVDIESQFDGMGALTDRGELWYWGYVGIVTAYDTPQKLEMPSLYKALNPPEPPAGE